MTAYQITYARVGNAEPVYSVRSEDGDLFLARSVRQVEAFTRRPLRSVRIACKEAREEGVSHFLD